MQYFDNGQIKSQHAWSMAGQLEDTITTASNSMLQLLQQSMGELPDWTVGIRYNQHHCLTEMSDVGQIPHDGFGSRGQC